MSTDIIRAGMIGMDTSHCRVFTEMLHDEKAEGHVPGMRIVAAYPSFSPDIEKSASSVNSYKQTLSEKWGVKIVDSIPELFDQADVFLIESVDGRRHLPELKAIAATGKPVYIDKPLASNLADAKEIARIVTEQKIPCFSSSSLRFDPTFQKFLGEKEKYGKVLGCDAYSPAHLEKTNPGLFWYGVHGVEILFTLMGRGCKTVRCSSTEGADMAVGVWDDGRIGTMRGIRKGLSEFGASLICEKAVVDLPRDMKAPIYAGLLRAMVEFFKTKKPPVPIEETVEICAFMDAAYHSSEKDGDEIKIEL
jgi:predicted dehydrogenase